MLSVEKFLFGYLDAKKEIDILEHEITKLREDMLPKSPSITGMPGSHSNENKMSDYVARLGDILSKQEAWRKKLIDEMEKVENIIEKVDDPMYRAVLRLRYIDGMKWEDIEHKILYSPRQTFRIRFQALKAVEKLLDDGK